MNEPEQSSHNYVTHQAKAQAADINAHDRTPNLPRDGALLLGFDSVPAEAVEVALAPEAVELAKFGPTKGVTYAGAV